MCSLTLSDAVVRFLRLALVPEDHCLECGAAVLGGFDPVSRQVVAFCPECGLLSWDDPRGLPVRVDLTGMTVRVCAWCSRVLGTTTEREVLGITHGLCAACKAALESEAEA